MRLAVLPLLVLVALSLFATPAFAQLTNNEIKDEVNRLDTRWYSSYGRAVEGRDVFASLHDSVYHPAYKELVAAKDKYRAVRGDIVKAIEAGDNARANKLVVELEQVGEALSAKAGDYQASSANWADKIIIILGVFAFALVGIVVMIVRLFRRKTPATVAQRR